MGSKSDYLRSKAIKYAWRFSLIPYRWSGDDPLLGYDCSGFIHEILQAVGLEENGFDSTADYLYRRFKNNEVPQGREGCLVFWFTGDKATHVMLVLDEFLCLGAAGGGSATTSIEQAIKSNAFIKMRPLNYRGANYKIVDPFKGVENEG